MNATLAHSRHASGDFLHVLLGRRHALITSEGHIFTPFRSLRLTAPADGRGFLRLDNADDTRSRHSTKHKLSPERLGAASASMVIEGCRHKTPTSRRQLSEASARLQPIFRDLRAWAAMCNRNSHFVQSSENELMRRLFFAQSPRYSSCARINDLFSRDLAFSASTTTSHGHEANSGSAFQHHSSG